jgi:hypothetical protein
MPSLKRVCHCLLPDTYVLQRTEPAVVACGRFHVSLHPQFLKPLMHAPPPGAYAHPPRRI